MRTLVGIAAACSFLAACSLVTARASASDIATRCTQYGCSQIVCNRTGDHCRRYDEIREERTWYNERAYDSWYGRNDRYSSEWRWRRNCDPDNPTCRKDYRWSEEEEH